MFLKKIRFQNIKCFKDLEIDFTDNKGATRKTTVILGKNGTGKTNLLRSIALMTCGSSSIGEILTNPNAWIKSKESKGIITAVLGHSEKSEITKELRIHKDDSLTDLISRNEKSLKQFESAIGQQDQYFTLGYGVVRRMGSSSFTSKQSVFSSYKNWRSGNIESLFHPDAILHPLDSWAMDLDYQFGEKGLLIVKKALNKLLPEIKLKGINRKEKRLIFNTEDGEMDLYQLSEGYQITAAWVGDLLYRISSFYDNVDPLKATGLLLIDELGLHLHPSWQRHMLKFIRTNFPNMQLVSTTHSPFIAQQCGLGELQILHRKNKLIKISPYDGIPNELLIHQIVMSDIFGLETDESLRVENLKKEYDDIKEKKELLDKQKQVEQSLQNLPLTMKDQRLFNEDYVKILQDLQKEIKKSNSDDSNS